MKLNINEILDFLPHRYPFLLVDRIEEVINEPNLKQVTGYKNVTYNEPFFQGHFPDEPVMPGVLILEAMGQVGAILLKLHEQICLLMQINQVSVLLWATTGKIYLVCFDDRRL